jgi:outer membrane protein TolC
LNLDRTRNPGQSARKNDNPRSSCIAWHFGLLLGAAVMLPASLPAQISLSTVVDLAQKNSSTVKLADADLSKALAVLAETKDVYIPNFVLGSNFGPPSIGFPTGQPSIASGSMQSLAFSFPQRQYLKAARAGIEAASLNLKDAREQAALEASTNYIELDAIAREIETGQQQAEFADRLLAIEQQRQEAGVDSLSEVLEARLKVAQLKLSRMHLQSRAASIIGQLVSLTGLPAQSFRTDHASIPEIPAITAADSARTPPGLLAAQAQATSRQYQAHGDVLAAKALPIIEFGAQYNRDSTLLNNYSYFYQHFKADNFSAGFTIQLPLFDMSRRAKAKETAVEALRARVEAEQAQRQNEVQIATLSGSLQELDALAEVASLKQQIAAEQLKTVQTELESGNGAGVEPGATPQPSPKLEQLARIDERQKAMEALDAGLDLSKARLNLLRALGHMDDWLHTLSPGPSPAAPTVSPASGPNAPLSKPGS